MPSEPNSSAAQHQPRRLSRSRSSQSSPKTPRDNRPSGSPLAAKVVPFLAAIHRLQLHPLLLRLPTQCFRESTFDSSSSRNHRRNREPYLYPKEEIIEEGERPETCQETCKALHCRAFPIAPFRTRTENLLIKSQDESSKNTEKNGISQRIAWRSAQFRRHSSRS